MLPPFPCLTLRATEFSGNLDGAAVLESHVGSASVYRKGFDTYTGGLPSSHVYICRTVVTLFRRLLRVYGIVEG